jgi:hypothetical protein
MALQGHQTLAAKTFKAAEVLRILWPGLFDSANPRSEFVLAGGTRRLGHLDGFAQCDAPAKDAQQKAASRAPGFDMVVEGLGIADLQSVNT